VSEIIIAADNDGDNDQTRRFLARAVHALAERGHKVRVARPPTEYKDFNDLLNERRTGHGEEKTQGAEQ